MAKNTYGTGAFLVLNTGDRRVISRAGPPDDALLRRARGAPPTRSRARSSSPAPPCSGCATRWASSRTAAETGPIAESVPDTQGVYVVPAFTGLGAPTGTPGRAARSWASPAGPGAPTSCRATLESLAYQSRDVIDAMNEDSGVPLRELRVDGGACANDFLMQFQADILGVPVDRPGARRDDRGGRGVPGRPRGRALEGRGVARRPTAARSPLHAGDAAGAARGALLRLEGRRRARPQPWLPPHRPLSLSRSPATSRSTS